MVEIEITDPELALKVLSVLDPIVFSDSEIDDDTAHRWLDDVTWKIQQALLKEQENTWKHLESFMAFTVEINEFGDVRINDVIYKPEPYTEAPTWNGWATKFPNPDGHIITIDPIYFVKRKFNKDLEL
jgi:hypothetical protein